MLYQILQKHHDLIFQTVKENIQKGLPPSAVDEALTTQAKSAGEEICALYADNVPMTISALNTLSQIAREAIGDAISAAGRTN